MDAEIGKTIERLEVVKQKITTLQGYINEAPEPRALKLAKEIIEIVKIPREISSGQIILPGCVPFQCNSSCPELYPNARVMILKEYAEGLENSNMGHIIR